MKIGIITHYYKSKNYGGNLQAYALQRYLGSKYTVEQICYENITSPKSKKELFAELGFLGFSKKCVKYMISGMKNIFRKRNREVESLLEKRKQAHLGFNQNIPHSNIKYTPKNIAEAESQYDCFITGSDQVWHPSAVNDAYLLKFVQNKPKLSYAASLAVSQLTPQQEEVMHNALQGYWSISVREENAVVLLKDIIAQKVEWVLDPVFLFGKEEWSEMAVETPIKEKYLFCYFLGTDKKCRNLAKAYAQKKNLKIVTFPYLQGVYQTCDKNFGDIPLYDVDPLGFVSLIKNAECVFTDSFHALAFSRIFEKQYFVFNRNGKRAMNDRIYSICKLFDEWGHFCDGTDKLSLKYIIGQTPIDYTKKFELFEKKKAQSRAYLWDTLEGVEKNSLCVNL